MQDLTNKSQIYIGKGSFCERVLPLLVGVGLLLSISTNLRVTSYRIGPGEVVLLLLAVGGLVSAKRLVWLRNPIVWFIGLFAVCATLGGLVSDEVGGRADWYLKAYLFTGAVSIGLAALLSELSNLALRRSLWWLISLTAVLLWFGFAVYLKGDMVLIKALHMSDSGDLRYSGWSENPNQLALLFVPLPIWLAALWQSFDKPNVWQIVGYGALLLALMLMGLLVRSDGLFVVWVLGILLLLVMRMRWDMKVSRLSLLSYALAMVLCVVFVKTFAHGEVRKSFQCMAQTIPEGVIAWKERCYKPQAFHDHEALRIGYSDPVEKTGLRQALWQHGLKSWAESPWFGHGPGNFSWMPNSVIDTRAELPPEDKQETHNMMIEFLVQGGLLPGIAWVALILFLLARAFRERDSYSFSVVLMMAVFTFFHSTRQPYLWFTLIISYEAIRRRLFLGGHYKGARG